MSSDRPPRPTSVQSDVTVKSSRPTTRTRLNRDRVLRAAVALADRAGIEAVSMRHLAHELGVVPMALYKHVANKEELLDGMVDIVIGDIDPAAEEPSWKQAVRQRILSARRTLLHHPWAPQVIESRGQASPVVLEYMNSLIGTFRTGGLSADLTHHAMHALGSRMWGFTQEVFPAPQPPTDPELRETMLRDVALRYPHIIEIATISAHDPHSAIGCDDQFEFEFALDLLLDGFDRLHRQSWSSTDTRDRDQGPRPSPLPGTRVTPSVEH